MIRTGNRVISPVVVGRKEQQLRLGEPKRSLVLDNTHGHPVGSLECPKERVLDREIHSTIKKGHKALVHTLPQRSSTCLERAVVTQRQPRSKLNFPGGLPIDTDCTTNKSSREKRHQGPANKWNDWHMVLRWGTRTKWPIGATKLMYDEDSLEPRPVSSNWQHLVSKEAADEQIYNKRRTAESTMWN